MANEQSGTDVLLLVNTGTPSVPTYEAVGSQRDASFDEATAEIDVSSKESRAKRVLPGRYSANVTLDHLYVPNDAGYLALKSAMRDGELILIARQEDGAVTELASALITSLSDKQPDQAEAVVSISLTIDGFWSEAGS